VTTWPYQESNPDSFHSEQSMVGSVRGQRELLTLEWAECLLFRLRVERPPLGTALNMGTVCLIAWKLKAAIKI
jgi:hypothetical protein